MVTGASYTPPITWATFRRTARVGIVAIVVVLALAIPFGYPTFGVFGAVGMALGILNSYLTIKSVARMTTEESFTKARFSATMLVRLTGISIIAVVCALLFRPYGVAVFGGLAVFQILAAFSSALPLIKETRKR